jgi:hypothetical protein
VDIDLPDSTSALEIRYQLLADPLIPNGAWLEWSAVPSPADSDVPTGFMRMTKSGSDQWQITSGLTAHTQKTVAVLSGGLEIYRDTRVKVEGIPDAITPRGLSNNDQDPGLLSPFFLRSRYAGAVPITVVNRPGGAPDTTLMGDELRIMEPTWENDTAYVYLGQFMLRGSGLGEITVVSEATQVTGVERVERRPGRVVFALPAPNPSPHPTVAIRFRLGRPDEVRFELLDVAGRRVAQRASQRFDAGAHELRWNTGLRAPGLYFARLVTGSGETAVRRWVLIR